MGLDGPSLLTGLTVGFLLAGALGFLLARARDALQGTKAPDKPMAVVTKDTPRTVMNKASTAFRRFLMWSLVLVLSVGLALYLVVRLIQSAQW